MSIPNEALHDLMVLLNPEKQKFLMTGLYPLPSYKGRFFYHLRTVFVFICSWILLLSMIIQLLIGVDDLSQLTGILYYMSTQTAYLWKLTNFEIGRAKILKIEKHFAKEINYTFLEKYGWDDLKSIMFGSITIARIFRFSVIMVVSFYAVYPMIDKNSDQALPLAGWYPVDTRRFYIPLYVMQMFCVCVSAFTNSNLDIITAFFISIAAAQLRMLKKALMDVNYSRCNNVGGIHADDLRQLVHLHEHILTYIAMIENMFSNGIFVQFLSSILVICMTGFQMLVVPVGSVQFALLLSYFICMMCQVAMYCWYGNEILFESDGITRACYMSTWYEGTKKDKMILFLIMERSKKQIKLTAGKMFTLTLTTLLMILKSSYSYFAVLQQIYSEK